MLTPLASLFEGSNKVIFAASFGHFDESEGREIFRATF